MSEERLKKIAKEEFMNNVMTNLDSALIFTYIKTLEDRIDKADNKNLELIEIINKVYDVIENKNITGIEARLKIQDILESKGDE